MSRNYKFHNPEGVYICKLCSRVDWVDIFTRLCLPLDSGMPKAGAFVLNTTKAELFAEAAGVYATASRVNSMYQTLF